MVVQIPVEEAGELVLQMVVEEAEVARVLSS
jgi:hypothetical protein